jgi:uncharacterized membrane protein YkvA (DUF1232 family)
MTRTKIVVIIAAIIYVVSPVDAVPDIMPIVGWLDDALVGGIGTYTAITGLYRHFRAGHDQKER